MCNNYIKKEEKILAYRIIKEYKRGEMSLFKREITEQKYRYHFLGIPILSIAHNRTVSFDLKGKDFVAVIKNSPLFDAQWYLESYPDVVSSSLSPAEHYFTIGYKEGKDPSAYFSTNDYLEWNGDVLINELNPLLHYECLGRAEGRALGFQEILPSEEDINVCKNRTKTTTISLIVA